MSNDGKYFVYTGFDRPLNYIFLDIEEVTVKDDIFIFDSLEEIEKPFDVQTLDFYKPWLDKFNIEIPVNIRNDVERDQREYNSG